jgi:tetratricopeptide (TPR) repeat protein
MTTDLEFIDEYFSGGLSNDERLAFEKKLETDQAFADEAAFYLSTMAVSRQDADQEKKQLFKKLYEEKETSTGARVIKLGWIRPVMAAAAVLLLAFMTWTFFLKPPSATQMADRYMKEHFTSLGVVMGSSENKLQEAKSLFNSEKYPESLSVLENILKEKPLESEVVKLAGIVSLRMNNYDKALGYFEWLAEQPGLFDNPGHFLQALTLMKRNLPADKQKAKILLQEVVDKDLSGKEDAVEWLKHL